VCVGGGGVGVCGWVGGVDRVEWGWEGG